MDQYTNDKLTFIDKITLLILPSIILYIVFVFIGCVTMLTFDFIYITNWVQPARFLFSLCSLVYIAIATIKIRKENQANG